MVFSFWNFKNLKEGKNLNIAPMGTASFFCFWENLLWMTNRRSKKRYSGQRVGNVEQKSKRDAPKLKRIIIL
ncbi:hypothetical protein AXA65_17515 [Chryseobacterium sp. FP211-J200]|nr:hypothetical protein AXA65_17515 [Chryseobacterium sp. FP211-J200]